MMMGKGTNKFSTLTARDLVTVQVSHLKARFELAEKSVLAEKAVEVVNASFERFEKSQGIMRVKPGQMVTEYQGEKSILPILKTGWVERLSKDMGLAAVKRQHEYEQYCCLLEKNPEATYGELWQLLGVAEQGRKRAPKGFDFLPEEPLKTGPGHFLPRTPEDLATVPAQVMKEVILILVEQYGCKKGQAEAMVRAIAGIRAWCCPKVNELLPGQLVWLTYSTKRSRRIDPKLFVPVVLTLLTPDEQTLALRHHGEFKALKVRQIERMTTEAWRQDGVLTSSDLEWLTFASSATIRLCLEAYQERYGVILPTAGTILDMGRTLTHKKIVVEMALEGMTTKEIAERIYHTPVAVDAYLKTFDKLLILRYYRMPMSAIIRVMGHGRKLIEEHLALAEKHFPTEDALKEYLEGRGVALEKIC
ncbi:MAG: DUF1670 domain-containing protein [Lentisphaeria bacterium]|nr:DUF1670 domain-containing protein [Lentisphaeria bacterium]